MPNPLRLAVIAKAHFGTVRLPFPPAWVQRIGLALGAPLGSALGYRSDVRAHRPGGRGRGRHGMTWRRRLKRRLLWAGVLFGLVLLYVTVSILRACVWAREASRRRLVSATTTSREESSLKTTTSASAVRSPGRRTRGSRRDCWGNCCRRAALAASCERSRGHASSRRGLPLPVGVAVGKGTVFVAGFGSEDGSTPGGLFAVRRGVVHQVAGGMFLGVTWHAGTLYANRFDPPQRSTILALHGLERALVRDSQGDSSCPSRAPRARCRSRRTSVCGRRHRGLRPLRAEESARAGGALHAA